MDYLEYFERFPDAYAKIVESLDRVRTLTAYLRRGGLFDGVGSVLSIGSGDAAVEIALARELGFSLGVVEPAARYLDASLAAASDAGVRIVEPHLGPFQTYRSRRRYDLVLSLFSWFAFEFDRAILEQALGCCADGGRLLVCLQGEASPSTRISALSRASGINLTSEKLSEWASGEGFVHRLDTYHGVVAASRYLAGDALTETGRDLVSFLLATPWEEIEPALKVRCQQILSAAVFDQTVDFVSPCLIFER